MLSLSYTVPLTILSLVALISNVILILVIVLCKQVSYFKETRHLPFWYVQIKFYRTAASSGNHLTMNKKQMQIFCSLFADIA